MANGPRKDKTHFSENSKVKGVEFSSKPSATTSRIISGNSGYATADFHFPWQDNEQSLIITEPNEDSSTWQ